MIKIDDLDSQNWKKEKEIFGKKIGKIIRETRIEKGLTQEQVTERAGFYRTYIGLIENGKYSPSVFTVWRIARAMDIDIGDLLKGL